MPFAAFLAGGYYESTYSLLAAVTWLTLAAAASLGLGRRPSGAFWALAALGAWSAVSALWGPAGPALRTVPLVALYAGALLAAEWVDGDALLHALLWGIVVVAAAGLVGKAAGVTEGSRLAWPVTYANGLGLLAVTGVVLAVGLRPRLWPGAAAVCAACAFLTYSRSALLVGLACVLFLVVPRRAALVVAVPFVVLALVAARPLAARFAAPAPDSRDARRLVQLSGQGRVPLWRAAWREGRDHPLAGGGAGSWDRAYIAQTGSLAGPANAHSLALETFAELGLAGLALLAAFLALALRGQERVVVAVIAAFALAALVDWTWQLPAATLPALLAAGSGRMLPRLGASAGVVLAVAALALGVAAAAHGVGAAWVETGKRPALASRLLPYDARPWIARSPSRACRIDPGEPMLRRLAHPPQGCRHPPGSR